MPEMWTVDRNDSKHMKLGIWKIMTPFLNESSALTTVRELNNFKITGGKITVLDFNLPK